MISAPAHRRLLLLALDRDGTLLTSDETLSSRTRDALRAAARHPLGGAA